MAFRGTLFDVSTKDPAVIDALELIPLYADEVLLTTARDTHRAIASRIFGLVNRGTGNAARVPEVVHDGLSSTVYTSIGVSLRVGHRALRAGRGRGPLMSSRALRNWTSGVNGLLGDRLTAEQFPMAFGMTIRLHGEDVPLQPAHLAAAFPEASHRVVVLLHGLGENDQHWEARRDIVGATYVEQLERLGWTPVVLRYNSGLSIRENGVALASLLQSLVEAWPTDVRRLAFVGHSMGGLIAHAACGVATDGRRPWLPRLTDVIALGTPHTGADLAKVVQVGSKLFAKVPETRGLAHFLDTRSIGIDDLSDGLPLLTPVPGVRYRLVAATLGSSLRHPLGDILVRAPSAYARKRRREMFPGADVLHLPRTGHFGLLNHHDVHLALKEWLSG